MQRGAWAPGAAGLCQVSELGLPGVRWARPGLPVPRPPHVSLSCRGRLRPGAWVSPGFSVQLRTRCPQAVPATDSCWRPVSDRGAHREH